MELNKYAQSMKQAREDRGLSQTALAKAAGISRLSLANYETGKQAPSLNALVSLSDALHMSVDDFIGHKRKSILE
jgi:transcriptional regulator with XRE-family HTH domain